MTTNFALIAAFDRQVRAGDAPMSQKAGAQFSSFIPTKQSYVTYHLTGHIHFHSMGLSEDTDAALGELVEPRSLFTLTVPSIETLDPADGREDDAERSLDDDVVLQALVPADFLGPMAVRVSVSPSNQIPPGDGRLVIPYPLFDVVVDGDGTPVPDMAAFVFETSPNPIAWGSARPTNAVKAEARTAFIRRWLGSGMTMPRPTASGLHRIL